MHKKFKKFLQAGVVIPILTTHLVTSSVTGVAGIPTVADILSGQNRKPSAEEIANKQLIDTEAKKIDAYFAKYDLPMEGYGQKLAQAAFDNDLPLSTLAAMAMIESTGNKFGKGNNPFGYASLDVKFDSIEDAIDVVGETLAAKRPATAKFYEGKTLEQKLRTYNGPSHIADARYVTKVKWVMDQIDSIDVSQSLAQADTKSNS